MAISYASNRLPARIPDGLPLLSPHGAALEDGTVGDANHHDSDDGSVHRQGLAPALLIQALR